MSDINEKEINLEIENSVLERDANGNAVINMVVENDDNFLSVFSSSKTPVISSEVASFIEGQVVSCKPSETFCLNVYSNAIDDSEKTVYKKAVKEYYKEQYAFNKQEYKRLLAISIALGILGVIILTFAVIFNLSIKSAVWSEVVDIVAWVFLWEAVDVGFFKTRESKLKSKRYMSLIVMPINFYPLNENKKES